MASQSSVNKPVQLSGPIESGLNFKVHFSTIKIKQNFEVKIEKQEKSLADPEVENEKAGKVGKPVEMELQVSHHEESKFDSSQNSSII